MRHKRQWQRWVQFKSGHTSKDRWAINLSVSLHLLWVSLCLFICLWLFLCPPSLACLQMGLRFRRSVSSCFDFVEKYSYWKEVEWLKKEQPERIKYTNSFGLKKARVKVAGWRSTVLALLKARETTTLWKISQENHTKGGHFSRKFTAKVTTMRGL